MLVYDMSRHISRAHNYDNQDYIVYYIHERNEHQSFVQAFHKIFLFKKTHVMWTNEISDFILNVW